MHKRGTTTSSQRIIVAGREQPLNREAKVMLRSHALDQNGVQLCPGQQTRILLPPGQSKIQFVNVIELETISLKTVSSLICHCSSGVVSFLVSTALAALRCSWSIVAKLHVAVVCSLWIPQVDDGVLV